LVRSTTDSTPQRRTSLAFTGISSTMKWIEIECFRTTNAFYAHQSLALPALVSRRRESFPIRYGRATIVTASPKLVAIDLKEPLVVMKRPMKSRIHEWFCSPNSQRVPGMLAHVTSSNRMVKKFKAYRTETENILILSGG